jgi:acetylornithine deacetylase/succinyl-diaminopimelate desuccinylase-like protein
MCKNLNMLRFSLLAVVVAARLAAQNMLPDGEKQLARDIYKQFVEIKSGDTTGATTPVAEAAAARLKAAGFPESNIFIDGASPTKANLVVRYHGAGTRKPMLLLAHTDVVEAKREDWSMDPFQFIERDGYFYGRGTVDDKAQAAVWIANLIRYEREGFQPSRDIIVALTADEEDGGPYNGVEWLLKNHRDKIDAEFALNEGGVGEIAHGRKISNDVQVSEKYVINFKLEVRNKGGHSSLPVPDNAIYHLADALGRLSKFGFPLKTNEVTAAYFAAMAKIETGNAKNDMAQVAQKSQEAMERLAAALPLWNASLRTTCVATQIEGGHAINALPQLAAANVNCRVLPGDSAQYVESTLNRVIADPEVNIRILGEVVEVPASPMRPDLLQAVSRVTDTIWPGVPSLPIMTSGATDGKYLRAAGIPTYGVQGFFVDRDDIRIHGRDERMSVTSFYEGQAFLYELVKSLAK